MFVLALAVGGGLVAILLIAALLLRSFAVPPARTGLALVELRRSGSDWYLVPYNAEGKTVLDASYTNDSAKTTVALTLVDAGRGGFGDTNQPYAGVKLALS